MIRTLHSLALGIGAASPVLSDAAVKCAVILMLAVLVTVLLRRKSAALRHLVWMAAIVAVIAVPLATTVLPRWHVLPTWIENPRGSTPAESSVRAVTHVERGPSTGPTGDSSNRSFEGNQKVYATSPRPVTATDRSPPSASELATSRQVVEESDVRSASVVNWAVVLTIVWGAGFFLLTARLIAARWMLRRGERQAKVIGRFGADSVGRAAETGDRRLVVALRDACVAQGFRGRVDLLLRSRGTIPVVWGIWRIRLSLPVEARSWSAEQLRSVLLHEMAHVKRRDTISLLLTQAACALHWFNPLVWLASWRLHVERERACDDLVLSNGVRASVYAEHLLLVASMLPHRRWTSVRGLAMASRSSLERRLRAVLGQRLDRRGVSATAAAIALALAVLVSVPVAVSRAARDLPTAPSDVSEEDGYAAAARSEPVAAINGADAQGDEDMDGGGDKNKNRGKGQETDEEQGAAAPDDGTEPKHEDARALFEYWRANARSGGEIPGALIGRLKDKVEYFIALNEGHRLSDEFQRLLPRFDVTRDWSPAEAVALLDEVAAVSRIPLITTLEAAEDRVIHTGEPLPPELTGAAWGRPSDNGLRVAWYLEPRANEYHLNTNLRSRILVHNSGQEPVLFVMPSWQQTSRHAARDANGEPIEVTSTYWTTLARMRIYRLAPGYYCESPAPGIGIGAKTDQEDWAFVRPGAWIAAKEGNQIRFSPGPVALNCSPSQIGERIVDGRPEQVAPKDAAELWQEIVTERVRSEMPIPTDAADRELVLRRVVGDLFGTVPTQDEIDAFVADKSPAADHPILSGEMVKIRVLHRREMAVFMGTLDPGDIEFRVLAADPDAANRPRVATGPGYYVLGDKRRLDIVRTRAGNRRVNRATIRFFSSSPQEQPPGEPYDIALPAGHLTYAIAWDRDTGILWVSQKGLVRNYDFTDPSAVKETRIRPGDLTDIPDRFRDAIKAALDSPDAPAQREMPPER